MSTRLTAVTVAHTPDSAVTASHPSAESQPHTLIAGCDKPRQSIGGGRMGTVYLTD